MYLLIPHITYLWNHDHRRIVFCVCIDEFGGKYYYENDAQHLIDTLQWFYKVSFEWTGSYYCGFTLNWNYPAGFVNLTMPNYIRKVLNHFQHESTQPTFTPFPIMYSLKQIQYQTAIQNDTSPLLNSTETKKNSMFLVVYYTIHELR